MHALIIVDIQNDFLPGGALAVPEGDAIVPVVNRLMSHFPLIVATQDWHPADHRSFASQHAGHDAGELIELNGLEQVLWPDHCVQGTAGAGFAAELDVDRVDRTFLKGTDPSIDSYSGFFDNGHRRETGLASFLRQRQVERVAIVGLATDYCVKFTALDARRLGLPTVVVTDAIRGVDLQPGDCAAALREMQAAGVELISSDRVVAV